MEEVLQRLLIELKFPLEEVLVSAYDTIRQQQNVIEFLKKNSSFSNENSKWLERKVHAPRKHVKRYALLFRRMVRPWLLSGGKKGERWKISPAKFPSSGGFISVDQRDRASERIVIPERIVRARAEGYYTWRKRFSKCLLVGNRWTPLVDVRFSVVSRGKQWKSGVGRQLWKSWRHRSRLRRYGGYV